MKHLNLETSVINVIQTQLNLLCNLLKDKSSCSIFSTFNKSFNHQDFLSAVDLLNNELKLKISKQKRNIPDILVKQLMELIIDFLSKISIEEQVQAIQYYVSMMENFIFFLKARNSSEDEKPTIDKISILFDNIKQPLENQEFTYKGTFLKEFNEYFQDLMYLTSNIKFYKHSESLSRQFRTYSKNLELSINELFQLNSITNHLNYLYTLLECYYDKIKTMDTDLDLEQMQLFRKKPNCKFFSNEIESNLQDETATIKMPVVSLWFG